ncbi:MAG: SDR family oxidoreductase [Dehalococcoidia bacterium]|nr:SDR family oxidoreductase [Dehalococcoidia bacterium]
MGIFLCSQAAARHFIARGGGGAIVNISSIAGKVGGANTSAYAASNAAAESLTRSLARELASHGVNVICVCPGLVDTNRMDDLGREARWDESVSRTPLGRAARDQEVGEFIAWLCTRTASYITGQCINFDGGRVMER